VWEWVSTSLETAIIDLFYNKCIWTPWLGIQCRRPHEHTDNGGRLKKTVFISWRSNISSQRNARRRAIDAKYNKNITRLTRNHAFPRRGRRRSLGCCKRSPAISINLRRSQSVDNTCSVTRKSYIAGGPSNRPTWNSKSAWGPDPKLDKLEVTLDGWKWYL